MSNATISYFHIFQYGTYKVTKLAGKFTLTLSEVERGVFVFVLLQGVYQYGLPLMSVYMPCGNGFSQLAD